MESISGIIVGKKDDFKNEYMKSLANSIESGKIK
jgi:hypothetical protein